MDSLRSGSGAAGAAPRPAAWLAGCALLWAAACGGGGGREADAESDGGADAGSPGVAADSGRPQPDGGPDPRPDAAPPDSDAAPPDSDAASPDPDAAVDAGSDAAIENNRAPVADALALETDEDSAVSGQLTASDADGDALDFELVDAPAHGTLALDRASGELSYTPDIDFAGSDGFTFRAADASAQSDIATVTITVLAINDAPTASGQSVGGDEDDAIAVTLQAGDVDGDAFAYQIVLEPEHGVLGGSAPTLTYTPDLNFAGVDSFTYRVNDGSADSEVATVAIHVAAINDAPDAADDAVSVAEGGTIAQLAGGATTLLGNDGDVEFDALAVTVTAATAPAHGTVALSADGTFSYHHDGGESASDSFAYELCDDGTPSRCDVATVSVTVTPVNDVPVAAADGLIVAEGGTATVLTGGGASVLANDADAEGGALTVALVTDVASGTLLLLPNGTFSYAHDGSETTSDGFAYEVCDDGAPSACATAAVAIAVSPVNDPPVAGTHAYTGVVGNTLYTVAASGPRDSSALLAVGETDAEGDALAITDASTTSAQGGTVAVDHATGAFTYLPPAGHIGADSFTYTVSDDGSPPAQTVVTVDLTIDSKLIWYVDAATAGAQTGRSSEPFATVAQADAASGAGLENTIHVAPGAYSGSLALAPNQRLWGAADAFTASPSVSFAAGARPTVTATAADAVTLSSGNTVRGVRLSSPSANAVAGADVAGTTAISNAVLDAGDAGIAIATGSSLILTDVAISARLGLVLTDVASVTATAGGAGVSVAASFGPALDIDGGSVALTFTSLSSALSATHGVELTSLTGSLSSAVTTIDNPQASGIVVSGATGASSFDFGMASVTQAGLPALTVGDGYAFSDNPGSTFTFTIATDPVTQNGRGLFASNSGTINLLAVPFSITAHGGAAIDLRNTAGNVAGTGRWEFNILTSTDSSAEGIRLENLSDDVVIDGIRSSITDSRSHGLYGANLAGLALHNATVTGAGDGPGEHAVSLADAIGALSFVNDVFTGMAQHGIEIVNGAAGSADVTLEDVELGDNQGSECGGGPCAGVGLRVQTAGALSLAATGLVVDTVAGDGVQITAGAPSSAIDAAIEDGTFTSSADGGSAIALTATAGMLQFVVAGNAIGDFGGHAIVASVAGDGTELAGEIADNEITAGGAPGAHGISIIGAAADPADVYSGRFLIQGNTVSAAGGAGISIDNGGSDDAAAALHVTLLGNSVELPGGDAFALRARNGSSLCAQLVGNAATDVGANAAYRAQASDASSLLLYGQAATAGSGTAAADAYFPAEGNLGTPVSTAADPAATLGVSNTAACLLP